MRILELVQKNRHIKLAGQDKLKITSVASSLSLMRRSPSTAALRRS